MVQRCVTCSHMYETKSKVGKSLAPNVCSSLCFLRLLGKAEKDINLRTILNKDSDGIRRSKLEEYAENVFKRLGLEYLYEPYIVVLKDGDKDVYYCPDYFLPAFNVYLESKGLWWGGAKKKCNLLKDEIPNNFYVLRKDDLRRIRK